MAESYSPGCCIYCGSKDDLSKEHVIPECLGGTLVLKGASCGDCRDITSALELKVGRQMYWPLRLKLAIPGKKKHKKKRPTHWPILIGDDDDLEQAEIEIGKVPTSYVTMDFAPPGFYSKAPKSDTNPEMKLAMNADPEELRALAVELGMSKIEIEHTLEWAPFMRVIAKICHSYAISKLGMDGIEFYLPDLIVGKSGHLAYYVGGVSDEASKLDEKTELSVSLVYIDGSPHIVACTTIFGGGRFPTYEAVVGRVTDLAKVLAHGRDV